MRDYIGYSNGEWIPDSRFSIDPDDLGYVLGAVVFETLRTFDGKPFTWSEHVDRLFRSLKYVRIDPGLSKSDVIGILEDAAARNEDVRHEVGDFNLWPSVTMGPTLDGPPNVYVRVRPVPWDTFTRFFFEGAHGVIAKSRSYSSQSLDPKAKHHSRLNMVLGHQEVRDVDPDALPIFMDIDGNISEGNSFSVMMVKDGVIRTPTDKAILQGVSRSVVMDLADGLNIPLVEEDIQPYDLYTADEVFFTRTTPGIVPVARIDNRTISEETPGPVTTQLLSAYSELVGLDIVDQAAHYATPWR